MQLIDTHTHLYLSQFDEDRSEVIEAARQVGVDRVYLPNIDSSTTAAMLQMEEDYPGYCFAMMGLHPCSVKENYQEELDHVKDYLDRRSFVAVGEIGIDLYWDKTFFEQQKIAFLQQVEWAKEKDIPFVIHSREATDIIIELLQDHKDDRLRGIFHCFGGSVEQANKIIDLGLFLGIGGVVTFKKSGLDKTMEQVDLEHVVLETDSPYLSPSPYRGKRNQSAYVSLVAQKLADIKGISVEQVGQITSDNARFLFDRVARPVYEEVQKKI